MNTNKLFRFIFLFSFLFLLFVNIILINILNKERENSIKQIEINNTIKSNKYNSLEYLFKLSLLNNNTDISKIIDKQLQDKLIKGTTLVVRCSENNCNECVQFILLKIQKVVNKHDFRIILLLNYNEGNVAKIFRKQFQLKDIPIYNLKTFNLQLEEIGYPYCFIIDESLRISNIFVPDKTCPDLTIKYLDLIEKRYFAKRQ